MAYGDGAWRRIWPLSLDADVVAHELNTHGVQYGAPPHLSRNWVGKHGETCNV
jgi:hypothetical protein